MMTGRISTGRERWRWRNLSLRYRLMWVFAGFCLLTTSLFSLYALAFAYTVEDEFFEAMLEQEATRQRQFYALNQRWAPSSDAAMVLHPTRATLPAEISAYILANPRQREFAGLQGRHYHLLVIHLNAAEMRHGPGPNRSPVSAWLLAEVSQKLVFRRMRTTVIEILVYSALALLTLALLLAWWLARSTAKPLAELAQLIATLNPNQLPEQLPVRANLDEVGVLSRGLDALIRRVRQFIVREQEFTRDASHELRTPLTVIRCAAEQIEALSLGAAAQAQLSLIQSSVAQLQHTITALLSLAREANYSDVGPAAKAGASSCRVLPALERVIIENSVVLERKQLRVDIDVALSTTVALPESVLELLLANLVGNAIAHCDACSAIVIEVKLASDYPPKYRLYISNVHSLGVPSDPTQVFTKHEGSAGFGLGLAIVQRLAERFALDLALDFTGNQSTVSFPVFGADARVHNLG